MAHEPQRQSLVTEVKVRRPLSKGFLLLLLLVLLVALGAAGLAWHSEQEHRAARTETRQARQALTDLQAQLETQQRQHHALTQAALDQRRAVEQLMGNPLQLRQRALLMRLGAALDESQALLRQQRADRAAERLLPVLRQIGPDDLALIPLLEALRRDYAALAALPVIDTAAVAQQLAVVQEQLSALRLPPPTLSGDEAQTNPAPTGDAWTRLSARLTTWVGDWFIVRTDLTPSAAVSWAVQEPQRRLQWQQQIDLMWLALARSDAALYTTAITRLTALLQRDLRGVAEDDQRALFAALSQLSALPIALPEIRLDSPTQWQALMQQTPAAEPVMLP